MKSFSERNPLVVGGIGIGVILGLLWLAMNFSKLPFVNRAKDYSAYFAEAGGLAPGNLVEVSGFRVGQVSSIALDGARVMVTF
jgi:phospholipid/cholesterol/gamma-HCH transport system substrate-binding protein